MPGPLVMTSFVSEIVKVAKDATIKDNRRTYPVERFMTSPVAGGALAAGVPLGIGLGAHKLAPHFAELVEGMAPALKMNRNTTSGLKGVLGFAGRYGRRAGLALAIPAFSIGALQSHLRRKRYARALSGRLVRGKGLNPAEQEAIQNLNNY